MIHYKVYHCLRNKSFGYRTFPPQTQRHRPSMADYLTSTHAMHWHGYDVVITQTQYLTSSHSYTWQSIAVGINKPQSHPFPYSHSISDHSCSFSHSLPGPSVRPLRVDSSLPLMTGRPFCSKSTTALAVPQHSTTYRIISITLLSYTPSSPPFQMPGLISLSQCCLNAVIIYTNMSVMLI